MPTEVTPDRHTEVAASRTAEAAERTKETAVRTTVAAQRTEASADRRTELAANRTVLAAERTYAAWVRTGLMSLAAGVGAKKTLGGVLPEFERLPRASGARRAARRLVWPHRRELTTAVGPGDGFRCGGHK